MIKSFSDQRPKLPITPNPLVFSGRITDKYRFNRPQRRRLALIFFKLQPQPVGVNPKSNIRFINNYWQHFFRQNVGFRDGVSEKTSISLRIEPNLHLGRVANLAQINRSAERGQQESSRNIFRFVYENPFSGGSSGVGTLGKSRRSGSFSLSHFATIKQWVQPRVSLKKSPGLVYLQTIRYLAPDGTSLRLGTARTAIPEVTLPGNIVSRQNYPATVTTNQTGFRATKTDSAFPGWPYRTGLQRTVVAADYQLASHHFKTVLNPGHQLKLHYNQQFLKTDNPVFLYQNSMSFQTKKHILSSLHQNFFNNTVNRVVARVIPNEDRRESWDEPSGITVEQPEPGKPTRELRVRDILQTQRNATPGSTATERTLSVVRPLTFRSNINVDIRPDKPGRPEPGYPIREIRVQETLLQAQKQQTAGPTLRERVVSIAKPLTLIAQPKVRIHSDKTGFNLQRFQIFATPYRLNERIPLKAAVPGAANG
ncbi:MAG TPA: hypothetical protein VEC37_14390, partial [Bacillota bacterium]|nr:hypothetical protein [Bacillota bacterium]